MSKFDVVVIGSGAGGSPVAARLCAAGAKVLVIEKGKRYRREDFDRDEIEWCRRDRFIPSPLKDPHTRRNDVGQRAVPTTDGWISCVLGGGTVHMGGYFMRADPADARQKTRLKNDPSHTALDWVVPYDDIARFYDVAERDCGVSGVAATKDEMAPLLSHSISALVDEAGAALGLSVTPTPRGISTAARQDEDRRACQYTPLCASYGCPNDAKSSMAVTYLRRGERTGNLTIRTETIATKLVRSGSKVTGVVVQSKGRPAETISADKVIVACGAIESARLLLLSGDGFNPGGNVGKHLWFSLFVEATGFLDRKKHEPRFPDLMHGVTFLNRTVMMGGRLDAARAKRAGVDRSGTLQLGFVHDNPIHRAERVATESGRLLWGAGLKREIHRAFRAGRQILVEGFGESLPHQNTTIDLDPSAKDFLGRPAARITHVPHPRDKKVALQMGRDAQAILEKMGADEVRVTRRMSQTTVLQGGTCRFGKSPADSVTDRQGRVHGLSNLYVTDGGALPSSLCVPVTLTILANALRIAEGIATEG